MLAVTLSNGSKSTYKIKWHCEHPEEPRVQDIDFLLFSTHEEHNFPEGSFYFVGSRMTDPEDVEECDILIPTGYLAASWKYYTLEELKKVLKPGPVVATSSPAFTGDVP